MLKNKGTFFILETAHASMLVKAAEKGANYLYYGDKVSDFSGAELLEGENPEKGLSLFSPWGNPDFREPSLLIRSADGAAASDFRLKSARIAKREVSPDLPSSYGEEKCVRLEYFDGVQKVKLVLQYTAYSDSDAIAVNISLTNTGKKPVLIERFASIQAEVWGKDFSFVTYDGDWGSERQKHTRKICLGKCENASFTGSSSSFHNPFVMLSRAGEAYGFNLLYSGNHREIAEADESGRTRLIAGINPFSFHWELNAGETFHAPEGVMVYGKTEEEVSLSMRRFVARHIVRGKWKTKERPILLNNWEGTYFDFTRERILEIAKKAATAGAELFVLDDGWFGKRDNDFSSLGDWVDYAEKTGGIESLADEVRALGLKFGIWMEPEMISEDSDLYRKHPEYAMKIPRREPVRIRNQLMLNLADPQVQGYVFRAVSRVITATKAEYVKWDFNRVMTDCWDKNTRGGEYYHRYVLGLYSVFRKLCERFPKVLFEGCASGGARYDLGILCYMPQIWTSDNTDARDRIRIQAGTAAGYAHNTMGAHVSASPNHQTGNRNSLETRFLVACGGVLGYESDFTKATEEDFCAIKKQIAFYKERRALLQFGEYHMLGDAFGGEWAGYLTVSEDKSSAFAAVFVFENKIGRCNLRVKFAGLDEKTYYRVFVRTAQGDLKEVCTAYGELLVKGSIPLSGIFADTDTAEHSNPVYSRAFLFEKCAHSKKK